MSATITGAHRKITYKPGLNNVWVQLPKFWVGYVYALCGIPPERVEIDMDEYGKLTIKPDFKLEGKEVEEKRKAAITEGHGGEAEEWLRAHGLWNSGIITSKKGRPVEKQKAPSKES